MRLIGLTGGIATGKSTAARFFAESGARLIDADELARRVVQPGRAALAEIARAFGEEVIRADGTLDRESLGLRVFSDAEARGRLNAIVHPRIAEEARNEIRRIAAEGPNAFVVYDVPLLFETGAEHRFDLVVVVYVPREEQERRLVRRNGLSREQALARMASQMDIEEKARRAAVVLDNQGTMEQLRHKVDLLVEQLRTKRA